MENSTLRQSGRGPQTNWMLAGCVLDWLELPGRSDLMKGKAQQKMKSVESSTTKLTKAAGYKSLADHVNAKLHLKWTSKEAKSPFVDSCERQFDHPPSFRATVKEVIHIVDIERARRVDC